MNERRSRRVLAAIVAAAALLAGCGSRDGFPVLRGPYLGQPPPGAEPALFAPGIVSTGFYERDLAVSPDGSEIFYGVVFGQYATIMRARLANGAWTEPEVAPFARELEYYCLEPAFSPDGNRLYFLSTRPPEGMEPKPGWAHQNIWAVDRGADGEWGRPHLAGPPISTDDEEYFPSLTNDGTIYFSRRPPGDRQDRIWRARPAGGSFAEPEMLPAQVNGDWTIYNACISPDEGYLVACVAGKEPEASPGVARYYVFFRNADDRWSEGVNLGEKINPPRAQAMSPSITRDGKYLFFASSAARMIDAAVPGALTLHGLSEFYAAPRNGLFDIYWVDASFIEGLRPAASK